MENQERMEEVEIDLLEVFHALVRKWWAIAMSLIIGACLAGGVTQLMITPQYEASSMIYILSNTTSISSALDIQLGKQLTVDFETLATSRPVIEAVIDKLDLDTNYKEMRNIITVQNPSETQILKITCTNPDPILARDIANAMADATAARVAEVMVTDKPSTVEEAVVPEEPSSPSLVKNVAIGALLAALLAIAVLTLQVIMDDTIKKEDDVMKYLELNTLAAIPVDNGMVKKRNVRGKKAARA
ncbi:MAG: Wzz/FepE/Etk N-terminal domain-containing protein [Lachnospiraceae bacterium]|nr:Wzz/FepE/Etk N-terminal domain-containing protein [Lachnospiraceae bacterium]